MSFITKTQLGRLIGASLVSQFETTNPEVIDTELIPYADSEITRLTGLQPPEDPEKEAPAKSLQLWASWLILYAMMPHQQLSRDEEDLRTSRYNKAIDGLAAFEGVTMSTTWTPPLVQTANVKRVGDIP